MNSDELTSLICSFIFEKKGYDIKTLDVRNLTTMTDYFIICSADSDPQLRAIADHIDTELKERGIKVWHKEGMQSLNWVLIDLVDVVVHIFKPESRNFYGLERLWGDAVITEIKDKISSPTK
ncbi:MAG: ribosome silencing factor [Ignavibacteriaceae bacterium]|nr:ribosome silencing factor [Ignavibacteriaceae bacterium]